MNKFIATLLVSLLAAVPALAQHEQSRHPAPVQVSQATATAPSEGVVQKIDRSAGKITIKHGEIRNIGMPPMTMVFQVKERALLDKVKVGEKVKFHAEEVRGGGYAVTAIEPAR
jgi:Cu(I)/Ag(I) efflux system periplasmic protein CusF